MEERVIKLTLDKAKEFYKKGGKFKDLALLAFTSKEIEEIHLPKTWDEFCALCRKSENEVYIDGSSKINKVPDFSTFRSNKEDRNILPSEEAAQAHLALMQLHQLRDYYRNGWKPNWADGSPKFYVYISNRGSGIIDSTYEIRQFLSFQTKDLANTFLNNFRDLIIQAGDLL